MHFGHGRHQQGEPQSLSLMYAPRRHSCRLLLPPGWVALGFLLLLGCQSLLAHRRQMQVPATLRLQMPLLEEMAANLPDDPYIKRFAKPLSYVKPATRWHAVILNGRKLNDFVNIALAATAVRKLNKDSVHAMGVKVCFQPGATYGNLVEMLDLINRLGQQIYWLDIQHQPTAFYAVNDQAIIHEEDGLEDAPLVKARVCYRYPVEEPQPPASFFSSWKKYQQNFTSLWQQPWQLVAMLIAALAALSFYRLARPRPSLR